MRDYLNIGSSPPAEECVQVGSDNYIRLARKECRRYISLLRRTFGDESEGAMLVTKSFPHDFGDYYEVVCWYDDKYPESVEYAYKCELEGPETWS